MPSEGLIEPSFYPRMGVWGRNNVPGYLSWHLGKDRLLVRGSDRRSLFQQGFIGNRLFFLCVSNRAGNAAEETMRQLMNAIVRANVIVNLRDRALVAGIVVRTLLQHLKPALGKGKPTQPWQSMSWQSGHQATERMYSRSSRS